jgi:predicted DsbA family dithiol-disulfide isomerase
MKRLFLVCILIIAGCTSQSNEFVPNINAVSNVSEVGSVVQKVHNAFEISGYVYGTPTYDSRTGLWLSETKLKTSYTIVIYVNDSNLSVHEILFRSPIPDLDVPPGSSKLLNTSCEKNGRIQVYIYEDPYCSACISNAPGLANLEEQFASDPIDFRFKYLPTHSLAPGGIIANYGEEIVQMSARYYMCAEEQGVLNEFKACQNQLFNEKLVETRKEVPSIASELDDCASEAAMDIELLNECLDREDIHNRTTSDPSYALSLGIVSTPSTLVNCMFSQPLFKLESTLCSINESFKGCE